LAADAAVRSRRSSSSAAREMAMCPVGDVFFLRFASATK
jgi:hypothetical protein